MAILIAACTVFFIGSTTNAAEPEFKTVEVNGTTFEYVEQGTGSPVLFVHSAISDLRTWEVFREPISKNHRYIAYSRRYFGKQPWADKGEMFTWRQHAEDLIAFIQAVSKDRFTCSLGRLAGMSARMRRSGDQFYSAQ